jgi:hypothetical protein
MVERNPYLILGVDYGCSPDVARRSFARAARRVRRSGTDRVTTEDLTWALHEIQSEHADPLNEVSTFRVPADPQVFSPAGEGVFAPAPVPLARRTETSQSDVDQVTNGFADDVAALLAEVLPHAVRFDYGYQTAEGTEV